VKLKKEIWRTTKLGDLFKITSGGTPSKSRPEYYENGNVQWVRTGDLKDKYITKVDGLITEEALKNSSAKKIPIDTVLVAMYGATIGACSILATEAATNQACAAFLPNKEVNSSYLYYFLCSKKKEFIKLGVGGAQPNISGTILKGVSILLPPLEVQKKISQTLDVASELITLRKKQLAELDNLIKATFYDMFGDPVTNEKGWEVKLLGELSVLITKGSSPTWQGIEYVDDCNQVLFVTSENVKSGYLDFKKEKFLEEKFNEVQGRSILKRGDILINIVGASIGRAAVYMLDKVANINQAVALVRVQEGMNKQFLNFYLNCPKAIILYTQMQVDVARANLSLKNINDLPILCPPISLQNQFAQIVTKIEEQKSLVQKALDESQYLFDSLMSEYFE